MAQWQGRRPPLVLRPAVYAVTAHFACLVVFDELDADSNHRLRTARGTCRIYRFLSVALVVLRPAAFAASVGFDALAALVECAAAAFVSRTPG
jgi:hypothetical protein